MNLRMLCKFEVTRVEQALAARLNQKNVDLLSVNTADQSKYTGPEQMVLRQFVTLARAVLFAPTITIEQINNVVAKAGQLIELLRKARRPRAIAKTAEQTFDWVRSSGNDLTLGLVGIGTGSHENMVGLCLGA